MHIFSVNSDVTLGLRQASRCNNLDFVAMTYDFDFLKEVCNVCFKSITECTLAYKSIHIFSVNSDATLGLRQASRCNDMDFVADDL